MQKRKIGKSNLEVFPIGLGAMGMSEFYGTSNDEQSTATLHKAFELGVNFIDTADMYGVGHNETLIGKALKGRFHEIVLATKFGIQRTPEGKRIGINGRPEYVRQACDASLKRLGVDVIDLYYYHRVDPDTPIEETVGAMADLVKEGKVRYLGLSEVNGKTLKRAYSVHPITAVQSEYSIWSRDIEDANLKECRELGVATVAYSPLGRGVLTGKLRSFTDPKDIRGVYPRMNKENFDANLKVVSKIEEIATSKGAVASQIAIAWLLHRGNDIFPIPGTRRENYLRENIASIDISLTPEELQVLNKLSDQVIGTRYDENGMKSTLQ